MSELDLRGDSYPSAAAAGAKVERLRGDLETVRRDVDRLFLIVEALWTMVREQHGYSDQELFRRITEIDLKDGVADGRVAPAAPEPCPHCGRRNRAHRPICLYCGKARVTDPFAR